MAMKKAINIKSLMRLQKNSLREVLNELTSN